MTVALVGGAQLPMETAQEFTKATGFTVAVVPVDGVDALSKAGADVVLGLDGADALQASAAGTIAASAPQDTATLAGTVVDGAAAAIAYGRDDVCVIADKSWMSANGRPLPTSFGDLRRRWAAPSCRRQPRRRARGWVLSRSPSTRAWIPPWVVPSPRGRPARTCPRATCPRSWEPPRVLPARIR
ncbi:ABC-type thiamine transport system, periplasmic component [Mycobacteroides abscessus subsp. abscessus]|nr:ABC-type thiamine transport system, periplasmic component [Mycobacteroides abscessus subsp. abscessus]